ncbi:MAG: DUF2335 domain-containing protein [Gemmataceae bacterium]
MSEATKDLAENSGQGDFEAHDEEPTLPAQIENVLERLPPEDRREVEVGIRQMVAQYSGPVPHAHEMLRYQQIDPSFPERFVRMAENQSRHRQELETRVIDYDFKLKRTGQDYALFSVVFGLLIALVFAWIGALTIAAIVAGTTVVGVVTAFVVGRVLQNKSDPED